MQITGESQRAVFFWRTLVCDRWQRRGSLVLGLWLWLSVAAPAAAADRPNVLLIAIDDLNDWVGCLNGHPQAQTPHIDRLAQRGTLFVNAHCQAPLCNSSRTSLLTGLRPSTTGVYGLAPWFRTNPKFAQLVTLPQHFRQAGYRTMTTGKVYHGGFPPRPQRAAEFDVWGPPAGVGVRPEAKLVTAAGVENPLVDWGTFPHRDEDKGDWKVASWAVEHLKETGDKPFFLSVGFFLPHVPCYATQKWFDLYPEDSLRLPPILEGDRDDTPEFSWYLHWKLPEPRLTWLRQTNNLKPLVRAYLASISFVDSQVGRVLGELDRQGLTESTIVVLWSDHGWHLGEKAVSGKNTLWERSTRVPLMFAGPGIATGARCERPAELLDIYPTLVDLCDLGERPGLEGHSLGPQLVDAAAPRQWPAVTTHNQGNHAIRTEDWRYIHYADGSEELYDLRNDPNEWHNLAGVEAHAGTMDELRQFLPRIDVPPTPGSAHRILVRDGDRWIWEGKVIDPAERVE